ncbi:DUF4007 family protein [Qipengyuania sp. 483]
MARGAIFQQDYKPQFSGHETFPLRYGWLKKAFDPVYEQRKSADNRSIFLSDSAIADFGVGKNMVSSMRYWAQACNIIKTEGQALRPTAFGEKIFGPSGLDPYIEHEATLWLLHWFLCSRPDRTTWHYAFNYFHAQNFDREMLVEELLKVATAQSWPRVSAATVKRDVECFARTYAARPLAKSATHEDALESPLCELGLLRPTGRKDGFRFVRGQQPSLGGGVFAFAVAQFWEQFTNSNTLSFEALAHEPESPGRVFSLDEKSLAQRLYDLEEFSGGAMRWSETAGLRQLTRDSRVVSARALEYIETDYAALADRRAA